MDHRCERRARAHCAFSPHNLIFFETWTIEQFIFFTQWRDKIRIAATMNQQKCNIDMNSHCHNCTICIWVWLEITCLIFRCHFSKFQFRFFIRSNCSANSLMNGELYSYYHDRDTISFLPTHFPSSVRLSMTNIIGFPSLIRTSFVIGQLKIHWGASQWTAFLSGQGIVSPSLVNLHHSLVLICLRGCILGHAIVLLCHFQWAHLHNSSFASETKLFLGSQHSVHNNCWGALQSCGRNMSPLWDSKPTTDVFDIWLWHSSNQHFVTVLKVGLEIFKCQMCVNVFLRRSQKHHMIWRWR